MNVDIQRANMWKRIAAAMLDGILLLVLFTGLFWLTSEIVDFSTWEDKALAKQVEYETLYNSKFTMTQDELDALTPEERERYDAMLLASSEDPEVAEINSMTFSLLLTVVLIPIFLSYLLLEFFVPLLFGNGQSIGKKVFSLSLMRTDGVKLTPVALFVRTMLGKCTVETMVPIAAVIVGDVTGLGVFTPTLIFGLLAIQLGLLIITQNRSCIHDMMAVTVVVDHSSQEIFDSIDDLIQHEQEVAAEKAKQQDY